MQIPLEDACRLLPSKESSEIAGTLIEFSRAPPDICFMLENIPGASHDLEDFPGGSNLGSDSNLTSTNDGDSTAASKPVEDAATDKDSDPAINIKVTMTENEPEDKECENYLYICVPSYRRLFHKYETIENVAYDREFYKRVERIYRKNRGLRHIFSLRSVSGFYFVKVRLLLEYSQNRLMGK